MKLRDVLRPIEGSNPNYRLTLQPLIAKITHSNMKCLCTTCAIQSPSVLLGCSSSAISGSSKIGRGKSNGKCGGGVGCGCGCVVKKMKLVEFFSQPYSLFAFASSLRHCFFYKFFESLDPKGLDLLKKLYLTYMEQSN